MNAFVFGACLLIIILSIFLTIMGILLIDKVDIAFIGGEVFFFSFLALRAYDKIFNGYSILDPGDEKKFAGWYQDIMQNGTRFTADHNHTVLQSVLLSVAIAGAIVVILILLEFVFSYKHPILLLVKYPVGLLATLLLVDNMRTLEVTSSQTVRIVTFVIFIILHIVVFLRHDIPIWREHR